jgi:D-3-phosphoglycerate dehydrogenase
MTKILLFEDMHPKGKAVLEGVGEIIIVSNTKTSTLIEEGQGCEAAVIRASGVMDRAFFDGIPTLKVVGRHGVGYDNVDVAYARSKGVEVVYTPNAPSNSTAEHTMAMVMALSRFLPQLHHTTINKNWNARSGMKAMELQGKTLGIAGMGRIGKRIAQMASLGIGMNVLYHDVMRNEEAEQNFKITYCESFDEMLPQVDFVTLNVPLNDQTHQMINAQRLNSMKPTAFVVNTSRGGVIDEAALIHALQTKTIAGAGLDVFELEPIQDDNPLLSMPNVIVTPHTGGMSQEGLMNMSLVAEDIVAVLNGETPKYPVP